ncbi:hypothetical protein ABK040_015683 [Willaertia magna]
MAFFFCNISNFSHCILSSQMCESFEMKISKMKLIKQHLFTFIIFSIISILFYFLFYSVFLYFIIIITIYFIFSIITSIQSEKLIVFKDFGVQLEKYNFLGRLYSNVFIPISKIQYIVINEGFHIDSVIYYLVIILKKDEISNQQDLILPFEILYPNLEVLKIIYNNINKLIPENQPNLNSSNNNKIENQKEE